MKISIIIPTIRTYNWDRVYNSIGDKIDFELIFIGPEPNVSSDCWKDKRVKFIRDHGSPVRCSQIGLLACTGDMISILADDCKYETLNLYEAAQILEKESECDKNVIITKYTEGGDNEQNDDYYKLIYAYPFVNYTQEQKSWLIFNSSIGWRSYYERLGGWDCRLQTPAMSHADFSVRAQRDGCNVLFYKKKLCACSHMPNRTGDHGPIHDAHEQLDIPTYQRIYYGEPNRIIIDINNWRNSEEVWMRFK